MVMEPKTGIQVNEKPESHIERKKKGPGGLVSFVERGAGRRKGVSPWIRRPRARRGY